MRDTIVGNNNTCIFFFFLFCFGIFDIIREFWVVVCLKVMCTGYTGKVLSVDNGLQFTVEVFVLRLVRENTCGFVRLMFSIYLLFFIIFLVSIYGLWIFIGLRWLTVKVFDDVDLTVLSRLVCFD